MVTVMERPVNRCVDKEESKMTKTTTVQTADLWAAIDALDALPETRATDWYKRLVEAAEAATQAKIIAGNVINTH